MDGNKDQAIEAESWSFVRLDIPLGTVVHDMSGQAWVFVGWRVNNAGETAEFVLSVDGRRHSGPVWTYRASSVSTLLRKFPDIDQYLIQL
jgi:hypothetical protein